MSYAHTTLVQRNFVHEAFPILKVLTQILHFFRKNVYFTLSDISFCFYNYSDLILKHLVKIYGDCRPKTHSKKATRNCGYSELFIRDFISYRFGEKGGVLHLDPSYSIHSIIVKTMMAMCFLLESRYDILFRVVEEKIYI